METTMLAYAKHRRGKYIFFRLGAPETKIFDIPEHLTPVEYSPNYKLEKDEWFVITGFSKELFFPSFLRVNAFSSAAPTRAKILPKDKQLDVSFLCAYRDDSFFFQRVTPATHFKKRFFSSTDQDWKYHDDEPIIIVGEQADAIFNKAEDALYFRNLSKITSIFPRIYALYRKATDEEVQEFLNQDLLPALKILPWIQ